MTSRIIDRGRYRQFTKVLYLVIQGKSWGIFKVFCRKSGRIIISTYSTPQPHHRPPPYQTNQTTTPTTPQTIPIPNPPLNLPAPLCLSCTFSLNCPITFPPGQYSHTTNHPGASPFPPSMPPLHSVRPHPTFVVAFHTSCVKWPVAVLNSPPLKS